MSLLKIRRAESDTLTYEIQTLRRMKEEAQAASSAFEDQQAYVIQLMGDQKTATSGEYKATVVRRPLTYYNEDSLRKALGATVWNKVTKKVLDKPKLEAAVNEGVIDINVVAAHTTVKDSRAYVSFKKITDPEDG